MSKKPPSEVKWARKQGRVYAQPFATVWPVGFLVELYPCETPSEGVDQSRDNGIGVTGTLTWDRLEPWCDLSLDDLRTVEAELTRLRERVRRAISDESRSRKEQRRSGRQAAEVRRRAETAESAQLSSKVRELLATSGTATARELDDATHGMYGQSLIRSRLRALASAGDVQRVGRLGWALKSMSEGRVDGQG